MKMNVVHVLVGVGVCVWRCVYKWVAAWTMWNKLLVVATNGRLRAQIYTYMYIRVCMCIHVGLKENFIQGNS